MLEIMLITKWQINDRRKLQDKLSVKWLNLSIALEQGFIETEIVISFTEKKKKERKDNISAALSNF